ncbi:hypothetical protein [Pseudomonas fluorescens]|jgi:3-oxoacyl-[acyl-carrier-protein] synthase-3|uniref:hypothetical protein n=1 Tax=Pseudomonas fluorescens TaxID=294 RepID=UPI000CA15548|nr:hypothetical protein [Pseudomonas fluorescens]AUM70619.1 hypothetical protein C0J56_18250 [Pseudomonas fluorescens]
MRTAYLASTAYVLGEQSHDYREAASYQAVCKQHAMPDFASVFGWGTYWRTTRTVGELMIESVAKTLADSGLQGRDIDALVVCSSNFESGQVADYLPLLRELQLERAYPLGVTWGDCTMLLAGLEIARAQVLAGLDNVLVVSANRIEDEAFRFQHYALFSDGAASCLVTSGRRGGFEMLGGLAGSDAGLADGPKEDDAPLFSQVHEQLMHRHQINTADLEQVICSNVFLPVLKIKEGRLGIGGAQLYVANVARVGHCFSADSLINLCDYQAATQHRHGGLLMLTANASGLRCQALLQRLSDA